MEFDLSAASMKENINRFVQASGNSKMVALVVLAHGNSDGDILGVDDKTITVQELVNAFCVEQLRGIPKVMKCFLRLIQKDQPRSKCQHKYSDDVRLDNTHS